MNLAQAQEIIEQQKLVINYERSRRQWLEETLSNPDLPINTRLAMIATRKVTETARPGDDGFFRAHLPRLADTVGVSPSTMSRGLRALAESTQAIEHITRPDELEPYKQIVFIKPTPLLDQPHELKPTKEIKHHGGDHRVARCNGCGSENIVEKKVQVCADCGQVYKEFEPRLVNAPEVVEDTPLQDATGESSEQDSSEALFAPLQDASYTVDTLVSGCNGLPAHEELQALPQWVCWRAEEKNGKLTKVPYNAQPAAVGRADVSKPATWTTYEQACAAFERSQSWARPYAGVGFVFNHNGIVGIDQDGNLDPRIDSYTETSVSGNGLHIFARGTIPAGRRRNGIEMYDTGRFFAWTGKHLPGTPIAIEDRQAEIDALYQELAPVQVAAPQIMDASMVSYSHTDTDVLEKARSAPNGAKFTRLWEGDTSGYSSPSEADLALCRMLAYWSDYDVSTIDRLFRQSHLYREKWDRAARAGETYGQGTIARAIGERMSA